MGFVCEMKAHTHTFTSLLRRKRDVHGSDFSFHGRFHFFFKFRCDNKRRNERRNQKLTLTHSRKRTN